MNSIKNIRYLLHVKCDFFRSKLFLFIVVLTANCELPTAGCLSQELIRDRDFQQGFYVRDRFSGTYAGPITCDSTLAAPVWNTAEWGSKSSVLNMSSVITGSGMCKWADNYKDFRFGPVGAEEYVLYFGVNSQNEYNNIYRVNGQPWPHLLIEQRFSPPYEFPGQGPGCPPLSLADSLVFQIDSKLLYNQTIMNAGYDPTLHAAEFLVYFTVQNLNPSSSGYGKYVWLGMQLYDDRFPIPYAGVSYDTATATLINQIPYLDFSSTTTHNGTWVHATVDILPYAIAALDTAWANGFLNESTNLADYKIGGMNMGWELPGMNICTVGVKGISLFAYTATTGINEDENGNGSVLNIFPNPSGGIFTIQIPGGSPPMDGLASASSSSQYTIEVLNVLGEEIYSTRSTRSTINLANKPNGIYIIKVRTEKQTLTNKLIIQR